MIIQCPACGLQAKLPDSKEGAKVRCSECERVYVAKPAGARAKSQKSNPAMPIMIGAGVLVLAIIIFAMSGGSKSANVPTPVVKTPEPTAKAYVDPTGWDSELSKIARRMHDLAFERAELDLQTSLSMPHVWASRNSTEEAPVDPLDYESLSSAEQSEYISAVIADLVSDSEDNLVGYWEPLDGRVLEQDDQYAIVEFELSPRDKAQTGLRGIHWRLVKTGSKWRVGSWERWISDAEAAANVRRVKKTTVKKALSDGSLVLESEARTLPHDPTTSAELASRIDTLVAQLSDPNLPPRKLTPVREELLAIGKPATPILINELWNGYKEYEAAKAGSGDTYASEIKLTAMAKMLKDITGYSTTVALEAMGGTNERLESGIKQWYYWYDKKYKRFKGIDVEEEVDGLEAITDMSELTEKERREYEKAKREQEQDN
jgi:zinc ribbon protein